MKSGHGWDLQPRDGAQACNTAGSHAPASRRENKRLVDAPCVGSPGTARAPVAASLRGLCGQKDGDPWAVWHLPRVLGASALPASDANLPLASQPPPPFRGPPRPRQAGFWSRQGWQLKPDDSSCLPPSHARNVRRGVSVLRLLLGYGASLGLRSSRDPSQLAVLVCPSA